MDIIDVNVPNIGDVTDVDVIEVLIAPGDTIELEQSLITVESDKASMEIPAEVAGVVKEVVISVGDKVSEGSLIARIEPAANEAATKEAATAQEPTDDLQEESRPEATETPAPAANQATPSRSDDSVTEGIRSYQGAVDQHCDVVVIGAGPGGYSAAFRAADLGLNVVLIERYPTLGGVCLNVGCIPSKALLHTVGVYEAGKALADQGIQFGEATIDLEALRTHQDKVVNKLTTGLAGMAKARKV